MWEKPIWERVASLETNVPNIMQEIRDVKKTLNDFIKEIRDNYATKKELNDVKKHMVNGDDNDVAKEIADSNNRRLIWVVIITWIFTLCNTLIQLFK